MPSPNEVSPQTTPATAIEIVTRQPDHPPISEEAFAAGLVTITTIEQARQLLVEGAHIAVWDDSRRVWMFYQVYEEVEGPIVRNAAFRAPVQRIQFGDELPATGTVGRGARPRMTGSQLKLPEAIRSSIVYLPMNAPNVPQDKWFKYWELLMMKPAGTTIVRVGSLARGDTCLVLTENGLSRMKKVDSVSTSAFFDDVGDSGEQNRNVSSDEFVLLELPILSREAKDMGLVEITSVEQAKPLMAIENALFAIWDKTGKKWLFYQNKYDKINHQLPPENMGGPQHGTSDTLMRKLFFGVCHDSLQKDMVAKLPELRLVYLPIVPEFADTLIDFWQLMLIKPEDTKIVSVGSLPVGAIFTHLNQDGRWIFKVIGINRDSKTSIDAEGVVAPPHKGGRSLFKASDSVLVYSK